MDVNTTSPNSLCRYCANVCVESLVLLTTVDRQADRLPTEAYYKHHSSFDDLEHAALAGCEICLLILDCYRGCDIDWNWQDTRGAEERPNDTIYTYAKELEDSSVTLFVGNSRSSVDVLQEGQILDQVSVHLGPINIEPRGSEESLEYELPDLKLLLTGSRGTSIFLLVIELLYTTWTLILTSL